MSLNIHASKLAQSKSSNSGPKIKWDDVTENDIKEYCINTSDNLSKVRLNHDLILCDDIHCKDVDHISAIETMHREVVQALLDSSNFLAQQPKHKQYQVPGWNDLVKDSHKLARDSFLIWRSHGSPRHGYFYEQMKRMRAHFKLVFRQCKHDKTRSQADSMAKHLLGKNDKSFWKEVKGIIGNNSSNSASLIEGISGDEAICQMWRDHYCGLLNSTTDTSSQAFVNDCLQDIGPGDSITRISLDEIKESVRQLKRGKSCGPDGIAGEHLIHSDNKLYCLLAMLFNSMLIHSFLPEDFMTTLIVPIIKDKKGDVTSRDNYRPIALTGMFSKVFEIIILTRYEDYLDTAPNQFGYKFGLSTESCLFSFKETVNYYRSLSSNVYVCFLDASKAFDRVNHHHLFKKLLQRNMPKLIVRLLMVWYQTQQFAIRWSNTVSSKFKVSNGVRQGSVLSPWLFNVFIDELSVILNNSNIGCHINNVSFNHMQYADDSVLLSPSPTGLQRLLDICHKFATDNDMLFNAKKTFCMCIRSKSKVIKRIPDVTLSNKSIKWIEEHKYLGVIITSCFTDDKDIKRQCRVVYAKGNVLIRKFKVCSPDVKDRLFQSYCSNLYCSALWCSHTAKSLSNLRVAFNNVYRYLHNLDKRTSMSQFFTSRNLDTLRVLLRKSAFSLMSRVKMSDNTLVNTIVNSAFTLFKSTLYEKWHSALYML